MWAGTVWIGGTGALKYHKGGERMKEFATGQGKKNFHSEWVHQIAKELGILDKLEENDCYTLGLILHEIEKLKSS